MFASEGTFFVLLVNFWADGAIPEAALRESPSAYTHGTCLQL